MTIVVFKTNHNKPASMKLFICILFVAVSVISSVNTFAQDILPEINDAENCEDHPFFKRAPGYSLFFCFEITTPGDVIVDKGNLNIIKLGTRKTEHHYMYATSAASEELLISNGQVLEYYESTSLKNANRSYFITETSIHGNLVAVYKMMMMKNSTYWIFISLPREEWKDLDLNDKNSGYLIVIASVNE